MEISRVSARPLLVVLLFLLASVCQVEANHSDTLSLWVDRPGITGLMPGIAGLTIASFMLDAPAGHFFRDNQTGFLNGMADLTDIGGEKKIMVPALLLTYGSARFVFKNDLLRATSLKAIQSVIVTAIATESIKYLGGRARPFTNEGPASFNPLPGNIDRYKSMPSGHVSLSFALFTPFAETYSRWLYLVPVSVAWGRVYQDKHWLSDAAIGGGIGLVSGYLFTRYDNIRIIPNGIIIYL